jgi:hypothetical protein
VQYVVEAGASNDAVDLNIEIASKDPESVNLKEKWSAQYGEAGEGPELHLLDDKVDANKIAIVTNDFDQVENEKNSWFSSQSFGIKTAAGFMGMTWSPSPNMTRTLTPQLSFYIAVGDYGMNKLAKWTDVSNENATVPLEKFSQQNECTVSYSSRGHWQIDPGKPSLLLVSAAAE